MIHALGAITALFAFVSWCWRTERLDAICRSDPHHPPVDLASIIRSLTVQIARPRGR